MLPREQPDRIQIAFDDQRLVANAGLLLPVTLAHHLGLGELVDRHVRLGDAPGRANAGDKLLTLVASALAGGDCIDDADALRAGGTEQVLGCTVKAPSTLGTFLRSFRWGHVRQLDRVSREALAQAGTGGGPDGEPLTIDLDSIRSRRTRPLDWSRRRPAPQLHRPARLSPSASTRACSISSRLFPRPTGRPRLQPQPAVEPVQLRQDPPPDPGSQLVDPRGGAQRGPVRHPGQSVGQLDQRIRRSRRLRRYRPAGGRVGQTVDARVVTVPVHHQARIVGHAATDLPPLHAAFLIPRHVSLRRDHKRQTAGYRRSVAHRFASLLMAPDMQLSHSGCPAALRSSDCKSVSIPAALALAFLEAIPVQDVADVQSTNALAQGFHNHGASAPFVAVDLPSEPLNAVYKFRSWLVRPRLLQTHLPDWPELLRRPQETVLPGFAAWRR